MFFLIWTTLLFSVRVHYVDTGASVEGGCVNGFCVNLKEITAEAGLCGVILCSFNTSKDFTPKHLVWYKCEPSKTNCVDSDIIFTNEDNNKIQSAFRGRVSLLEPDVNQRNCSIIINDLTESDSGSYQLRVTRTKTNGFSYPTRATVSVKGLSQKPTVMIPRLTEGQQATLTCTAPGLCSGSDPEITWTWRGAGEKDSHITGNITAFKTEVLTAVTQRRSSTLTFNSSAEHHGTNVTCKVSFKNNITTEETVTLNVTYVKELVITGNTTVKKGDALNLTCSLDSFPASLIMWTKFGSNKSLHEKNENELQKHEGPASLILHNMMAGHSGQYICTATHLNNTLVKKVDVRLYVNKPVITGNPTVKEGDALNLTCSVERFGPYVITWTKLGSNKNLQKETGVLLQNDTGTATLVILNVTAEYSGQYICTAEYQTTTLTTHAEVTVTFFPKIVSSSGCEVQSEVLTCVCISEGFPSPTIKWPLLKNHTEYYVGTTVSDHTVIVTVSVKDRNYTTVECVSSSDIGEAKENLKIIKTELKLKDLLKTFLMHFKELQVIIAFLIGILLSATICCLVRICSRKKQKSSGNLAETLEMATTQVVPLIDACQAVENGTHDQEAAEGGAEAAGQSAPPGEVEYSDIDFSLLKRKSPMEAEDTQDTTDTEYAEIKNKQTEERQDNGGEDQEMLEGNEEVEVIIGEDEVKQGVYAEAQEEEEGVADVAVYSNVNEIMNEI